VMVNSGEAGYTSVIVATHSGAHWVIHAGTHTHISCLEQSVAYWWDLSSCRCTRLYLLRRLLSVKLLQTTRQT